VWLRRAGSEGTCSAGRGGVEEAALFCAWDIERRFKRSLMAPESSLWFLGAPACGIRPGAVTERWSGDAIGGDARGLVVALSSSKGNGAFREWKESCLTCSGLPAVDGWIGEENEAEEGLLLSVLAVSARCALKIKSNGESS
jgi:hypothetical protein